MPRRPIPTCCRVPLGRPRGNAKPSATGGRTYVEVAAVQIENVLWNADEKPLGWDLGTVKARKRIIYLDAFMQELTAKLVERYAEGNLFQNLRGRPWQSGTAGQRFSEIIRRLMKNRPELGLTERHTPYGARHTWITRALDNDDLTIQDVAEMAGTSVRQIERTYKTVGRRHKKLAGLADKVHRKGENIECPASLRSTKPRLRNLPKTGFLRAPDARFATFRGFGGGLL